MEAPIEIRYAGVVVAKANEVRRMTVGGVDMFLAMPEPLPAGTVVSLGNDTQARIEKVIESPDPSVAGIYVRLLAEGEASQPWVPSFRESEVPAPRPPAVVVSPVIVRPVHIPRNPVVEPRPEPPRPEPVAARPEPVAPRHEPTPLPEVVAAVVEAPRPFTAPLPQPGEQVAHFDSRPEPPPPAVVESAIQRERSKRSTIVVAIPPPAEMPRDDDGRGAVKRAVGEIDTGSRKVKSNQAEVRSASSIVVEQEPPAEPAPPPEPAAMTAEQREEAKQEELRLEDLSAARPLPKARAGGRRRRNTTTR
jgi:hypothetical protein